MRISKKTSDREYNNFLWGNLKRKKLVEDLPDIILWLALFESDLMVPKSVMKTVLMMVEW